MKSILIRTLLILITTLSFENHGFTKSIVSWKDTYTSTAPHYQRFVVLGLNTTENELVRKVENSIVGLLKNYFNKAISFDSIRNEAYTDQPLSKDVVLSNIRKVQADAIVTFALISSSSKTRYKTGKYFPSFSFPWYSSFWGYYAHWYPEMKNNYLNDAGRYFLEINIYESDTQNLVWSGQSAALSYQDLHQQCTNLVERTVNQLRRDGIINTERPEED